MAVWKKILVPLDGSEISRWALERAQALIRQPGAVPTLLGVAEAAPPHAGELAFQVDPRHRPLHDLLAAARDDLRGRSVQAEAKIRMGDPATEIVREIHEGGHELVLMATHGRSALGRVLFGNVALRVLQASPVPVLLFRPLQRPDGTLSPAETREPAGFRRILVPLDGSEAAEEILPEAGRMARTFESQLLLLRSVPGGAGVEAKAAGEYLEAWKTKLEAAGLRAGWAVREGRAAEEALAVIRERSVDAVALTTHGRTGAARAMYGSVAERLLRDAGVPVLAFRNRGIRARLNVASEPARLVRVE
jgi:nucleotide-binding universal stress UspA family protein